MNTRYRHNDIRPNGAGVFLRYSYAIPTLFLRYTAVLLLMLVMSANSAWGQTDYSGVFLIANNNDKTPNYNFNSPTTNYYMCPAEGYVFYIYENDKDKYTTTDTGKPFITTYQCYNHSEDYDLANALWKIQKIGNTNYYYIIHKESEKYLTYNGQIDGTTKSGRMRFHLETNASPGNAAQFTITKTNDGYFNISPRNNSSNYLNPAKGNYDNLTAEPGNNNSYFGKEGAPSDISIYGIVGMYNSATDVGSRWYLETLKPVITYDSSNHKIVISHIDEGATIYYTTNGDDPTTEQTENKGAHSIEITDVNSSVTIKAIAERSGVVSHVSEIRIVPSATISFASSPIIYNGSAQEPTATVKDGDDEIPNSEYTVSYSNNNINAGETVTVTITDKADGDYIVYGSTTFTINPAGVTLTANSGNVAYDGTEKTVNGYTCSVDNLTFEGVTASGSGTNIGDYPVTFTGVTIDTTKDTSGNYVVTATEDGTLTITPKPLTITADSDTKVYDGTALTKNSYTSEGLMAGDQIESVTITGSQTNAGSSYNVPSAAVIKKGDEVVNANYTITYTNGTLEVMKKPMTVTADAKTKAYGEDDPILTYTSEGLINEDALTGALTRTAGENVGEYAINLGTLTAGNNYDIDFHSAKLTITKVGLTITAKNHTITYGDAPAGNGVTYEGFVKSDTESVLGGTLVYDYSYTQYGDVGNAYTITPKGLTNSNYDITFVDGILTVTAKEVVINWTNTSFAYNGEEHSPTATVTGLVNGDEIGITVAGAQTNAGEYTATVSALTGDKAGNYQLPVVNTQSFTISPKSLVNGINLADGYTLDFGEGNTILLTDNTIGSTLVAPTDYTVGEDTSTSDKYSQRTVTGAGNYTASFNVRNAKVSLTTDASEEGWSATFAAEAADPSDIGHALPEGVMAFIITGIKGEWAIPEPLTYIPAGVPVLLFATKKLNGFVPTPAESEDVTEVTPAQIGSNMLEEVTVDTPNYDADTQSASFTTKQIYLLYNNEFVFNKAGNLKKGKVYLNPSHTAPSSTDLDPAPARLQIAWNYTTGIGDAMRLNNKEKTTNKSWYTLDGRRLNDKPSAKGLYIVDGKKTVVK